MVLTRSCAIIQHEHPDNSLGHHSRCGLGRGSRIVGNYHMGRMTDGRHV